MIVIVLAVVYRFGLEAFAWGAVAISLGDYLLSAYPNRNLIGYSWAMQARDLAPPLLLCGTAALLLLNMAWDASWSPLALMALKTVLFIALAGVGLFGFRNAFFQDAWGLFCNSPLERFKWA